MAVAGRDEQLPLIARQGPHRRHAGVEQRPQMLREDGLRRSLFAGDGQDRIGLPARSAPNSHAKTSTKPFSLARFKNGASASVAPPRTGNGSHLPDSGAGRASNCGRRSAGSEKSGLLSVLRQNRRSELVIVATKQVSCTAGRRRGDSHCGRSLPFLKSYYRYDSNHPSVNLAETMPPNIRRTDRVRWRIYCSYA